MARKVPEAGFSSRDAVSLGMSKIFLLVPK